MVVTLKRIAWLDSCRMPSRIHSTLDGVNTLCGHPFMKNFNEDVFNIHKSLTEKRWIRSNDVPRKIRGTSRYCSTCFKDSKKSIEWL